MSTIVTLARMTFLEVARQKFFNFLLLLAFAFLISSLFFQQFNFGSSELKFIHDLGSGTILFFGTILAVVLTSQLIFNEMDNRTAQTVLARPVFRYQFLVGKFIGVWVLMLSFVFTLTLMLVSILYLRESALMTERPELFLENRLVRYTDLILFGVIQFFRLGVICAMTLFFSAFASSNLYTVVVSFLGVIICQLQYVAEEAMAASSGFFYTLFLKAIQLIFPNFQVFNTSDVLVFPIEAPLSTGSALLILGYGLFYIMVLQGLAVWLFGRREL
jgi:ABC-2 type transport system permease protein